MNKLNLGLLVLLVVLQIGDSSFAVPLIFFEEDGYADLTRGLYVFDTETGTSQLLTEVTGSERFFAMDMLDQTLFAADLTGGLWKLDIKTEMKALIGNTGIYQLKALAIHPITHEIFGVRHNTELYSINPSDASATLIAKTYDVEKGLCFSPSGELYGFGEWGDLFRLDPASGATAIVGISQHWLKQTGLGIMEDATFTKAGDLYGITFGGGIFTANIETGRGTLVGCSGMGDGALGLTVPEPATVLLMGFGMVCTRTRRQSTLIPKGKNKCSKSASI